LPRIAAALNARAFTEPAGAAGGRRSADSGIGSSKGVDHGNLSRSFCADVHIAVIDVPAVDALFVTYAGEAEHAPMMPPT
jgi:hypothetical protein